MYQPKVRWQEHGDHSGSEILMWGHIKVGEVTLGGNGTWYAYFRFDNSNRSFKSLGDFKTLDHAKLAVEGALSAAEPDC